MIGIYKITSPSNRVYIGQSRNIAKRFREYSYYKGNGQTRLFCSFTKYGVTNHIFETIEECSLTDLNERERYWQEYYNVLSENGLNCMYVNTDIIPAVISLETLDNMRKAQQNRKPMTDDQKRKISESWKNRIVTVETKHKMSMSSKGKKKTPEHALNIGKAKEGFKHTEEAKLKMRKAKININPDELHARSAKTVLQFTLEGLFVKEWTSACEIERELGIKFQLIHACCSGKTKKSKGFIWKFKVCYKN
jgi:group I intron endonuclease